MAHIQEEQIKSVIARSGTYGGCTYWVDTGEGYKAVCFKKILKYNGAYCAQPAGRETEHKGSGRCKWHGGAVVDNNDSIRTGSSEGRVGHKRYEYTVKGRLRKHYMQFAEEEEQVLSIIPELALQRALMAEMIELYQETGNPKYADRTSKLLTEIGNTVERIERIQNNNVLTATAAKFLMARAVDVASRFMDTGTLEEFVITWHKEVEQDLLLVEVTE